MAALSDPGSTEQLRVPIASPRELQEKAAAKVEEDEMEEGELTPEVVVAPPMETPAQTKRDLKIAEARAAAVRMPQTPVVQWCRRITP